MKHQSTLANLAVLAIWRKLRNFRLSFLALAILAPMIQAQSISLHARRDFAVGRDPRGVVVIDLNGDGRPDIATANSDTDNVSVLLGNGDGAFRAAINITVGDAPRTLASSDINRDGRRDLVVIYETSNVISILPGNGDGTFSRGRDITLSVRPYVVASADLNNDGNQDVITVNNTTDRVSILLGNGDSSFQTEQSILVGDSPTAVVVGNFNNDGRPDLAVSNAGPNTISVLLGAGNGTFQPAAVSPRVGSDPQSVVAGDFNGDGRQDLAAANYRSDNISMLFGNGDGTFQTASSLIAGNGPLQVVAGDFNGDGRRDLAAINYSGYSISLFLGAGAGSFQPAGAFRCGPRPQGLGAGDFNGDGRDDLVTANDGTTTVSVITGRAGGTLQVARSFSVNAGRAAVGDFNRDGRQDFALVNSTSVMTLIGNGDGTFRTARTVGAGSDIEAIAAGDFNGDGRPDLVIANGAGATANLRNTISILLGNGDGTFQPPNNFSTGPAGSDPKSIVVGSFNGDGHQDIAVCNEDSSTVSVFLGNGNGTFQPGANLPVNGRPLAIAIGDFNGDGRRDIVTSNSNATISVLPGNGNGTFQAAVRIALSSGALTSIVVNDFNGDSNQDLATTINGRALGVVLLGNGQNAFQTAGNFEIADEASSLVAGDFNGDGRTDLAASHGNLQSVSILLGGDNAAFQPPALFGVDGLPFRVVAGDFNGDGRPDLATPNDNGATAADNVSVLLNLGGFGAEQEPNETPAQANAVTLPGKRTGSAGPGDSFVHNFSYSNGRQTPMPDLFAFTLAGSARVELTLLIANSSADLELFLLRDEGSRLVQLDASDSFDVIEKITRDLAPGRYLIGVGAYEGLSTYTLTATAGGPPPPSPAITSLNPNSALAGGPAFTLTVNGSNFVNGSTVRWNGSNRPTSFSSATRLTAAISAADIANAGNASVTVVNPEGAVSNPGNFQITPPIQSPMIISLSPNSASAGGPVFALTVNGSNFVSGAAVRWNGSPRPTSFSSSTQLSANITAADIANQGTAQVTVANPNGEVSNAAAFTIRSVDPPGRTVRVVDTSGAPGSLVSVPIQMVAQGNEAALSFSLQFDPAILSNPQVALGSGARDANDPNVRATLLTNTSQAGMGRLGVIIALPPGNYRFASGTPQMAVVTFNVAANPAVNSTTIGFADQPVRRAVSDANANSLQTDFFPGTLTLGECGNEGVLAPRPKGDGELAINDWVMLGRILAGLEPPPTGCEFQRADTAPRGTFGDGQLDINDWVQAGRYVAALDPVTPASGPSGPSLAASPGQTAETVSATRAIQPVAQGNLLRGQNGTVVIEMEAEGNEAALGFTVNTDPAQLTFISAVAGSGAQGATLILNTSQAANGRLGILIAAAPGQTFAAGKRQLVVITFAVLSNGSGNSAQIAFGDQPIRRSVADAGANSLTANWTTGVLSVSRGVANVSAASFSSGDLAVESIVAAFGVNLATRVEAAETVPLPTTLAGTTVKVKDSAGGERAAPLFFVAPGQINYLIPAGTALGTATITVTSGDGSVSTGTARIAAVAPALFSANASGQGVASAVVLRVKADGAQVYESVSRFDQTQNRFVPAPIDLGPENEQVFLLLFGTGFRHPSSLSNVAAKIGGLDVQALYAGQQGGFAGLDQINLRLPRNLAGRGLVDVLVTIDGQTANAVQLQFGGSSR